MGTIDDKIVYLNMTKALINKAMKSSGIKVPVGTAFRDYASLIQQDSLLDEGLIFHALLNTTGRCVHSSIDIDTGASILPIFKGDRASLSNNRIVYDTKIINDEDDYIVSMWARGSALIDGSSYNSMISQGSQHCELNWLYRSVDGIYMGGNGHYAIVNTGDINVSMNATDWFHIVLWVKEGVPYLYINTKEQGVSSRNTLTPTPNNTTIGDRIAGGRDFNGDLSNYRIYTGNYGEDKIKALYEEGYHPRSLPDDTDGLIHYYPLTGSGEDSIGDEHFIEQNTPAFTNDNIYGSIPNLTKSPWFKNTSLFTELKNLSEFTISFYMRKVGSNNDFSTGFSFTSDADTANNGLIRILNSANSFEIQFNINDGVTSGQIRSSNSASDDVWYKLSLVSKSSKLIAYIDDVNVGEDAFTNSVFGGTGVCAIGNFWYNGSGSTGNYLQGNIRELKIWNRALEQSDLLLESLHSANLRPIAIDYGLISYIKNGIDNQDNNYTQDNPTEIGTITRDGLSALMTKSSRFDFTSAKLPADKHSFCTWLKLSSFDYPMNLYGQYVQSATGRFLVNLQDNGNIFISVTEANSIASNSVPGAIKLNQWQFISVVKNGSDGWVIYIDGIKILTWSDTQNIITNQNTQMFGDPDWGTNYGINGRVANQRIYNRPISQEEHQVIYQSERDDFDQVTQVTDSLAGYWPLVTSANSGIVGGTNGTDVGTPTYDGESVLLGDGEYVKNNAHTNGNNISINVWVKSSSNTLDVIASEYSLYSSGVYGFNFYKLADGRLLAFVGDGGTSSYISSASIDDTSFSMLSLVLDKINSKVSIYINGVLDTAWSVTIGTILHYDLWFGQAPAWENGNGSNPTYCMNGNLARARAYNKGLTQAEVTKIYNDEKDKFI